jgi:hypothetical protein
MVNRPEVRRRINVVNCSEISRLVCRGGQKVQHEKGSPKMKPSSSNSADDTPVTADTGLIRLGGGWRLPSAKPTRKAAAA